MDNIEAYDTDAYNTDAYKANTAEDYSGDSEAGHINNNNACNT